MDPFFLPHAFWVIFAGLLGLLVGSFTNVLIHRLPRRESVSFPPSHCPKCEHRLGARDLVPVLSWLSLRGRCRYCSEPIAPRYPVVELLSGALYAAVVAVYPPALWGLGVFAALPLVTVLIASAATDLDTFTIPDALSLGGLALGLLAAFAHVGSPAFFPDPAAALSGALTGAGTLAAIGLLGAWVLRRFRERRWPEYPLGYPQIALGLLAGAVLGPLGAVMAVALSVGVNVIARRAAPLPEALTLGGALLAVALAPALGRDPLLALQGAVQGAGAAALIAGVYWAVHWARTPEPEDDGADSDPEAMGFGDVKLMGAVGAFLGASGALLTVGVAVFAGALIGVVSKAITGESRMKFAPALAIGALLTLLLHDTLLSLVRAYLGL